MIESDPPMTPIRPSPEALPSHPAPNNSPSNPCRQHVVMDADQVAKLMAESKVVAPVEVFRH